MSKNALHRTYDRLTPEERFRLDVLATARGDVQESERLTRTCQRETYTMNHRGYTGRWSGTYEITLRMYVAVNNELAKLQMVDAFRELVPYSQSLSHNMIFEGYFCGHESGSRYAWGRAGKDGEPPGYEEDIEESEENADPATEADMDGLEATVEEYRGVPPGDAGQAGAHARLRRLEPVGRASAPSARSAWASAPRQRPSQWQCEPRSHYRGAQQVLPGSPTRISVSQPAAYPTKARKQAESAPHSTP